MAQMTAEQALLALILDEDLIAEMTDEEVDQVLRFFGADPKKEPEWVQRARSFLEKKIAEQSQKNS